MAQIHILSKETIDKIAAGEVVERPSSVVKELLENAVDAGATAVTVEIKEGGISFIRVTDNGCGIDDGQVPLAFLRHATSKIQTADDLSRIVSLGFRGEALSSIAAVSRLELITKTEEKLTGIRCLIEGGEEVETEEVGAPDGTTVIVRNLFFNTPVRKKFLKHPQTEGGYISDLMEHMAMSHPRISFKYMNNGQLRFHTSGNGNLQEIIYRIYGKGISDGLVPIDVEEQGIHMSGFLGKPEINRANRNFEIYFVNGRFIKSSVIGKAMEEGYRKYVMQHKFPFAVLHFTIDSEDIDVNVHPTKMEVRFTNRMKLYDFIEKHIREKLHSIELIPEIRLEEEDGRKKDSTGEVSEAIPEPFEKQRLFKENVQVNYQNHYPRNQTDNFPETGRAKAVAEESAYQAEGFGNPVPGNIAASEDEDAFFVDNREVPKMPERPGNRVLSDSQPLTETVQMNFFEEKMLTKEAKSEYRIMGQVFDTYWLVAFHDKLFIIDQHAAHEKVKYEKLMKQLKSGQIPSQIVNPPIIITLSGKEEGIFKEYMHYFEEMGFEIEAFGGNEYAIRGVPADLYGYGEARLFTEVMDELSDGPMKGTPNIIRQKIASMACKAAVKGNMSLGTSEMEALIDQLLMLEDPYHCPHGRPTIISMSKYELEKKFKRIV
ncbi:DNA mismatch repair endonuclease MutL [Lachnospiraceae bacterium]|nr:DNA mismatch repair endonuclease MutL [Lachnospiraceae bacterium]